MLTAAALTGIGLATRVWPLVPLAMIICAMFSLIYASHVYYATKLSADRSKAMAVHELLIAGGLILIGLGVGGLDFLVGLRGTYYTVAGLVIALVFSQLLWAQYNRRSP